MVVFSSDVMARILIGSEDRESRPQTIVLARPFPEGCGLHATLNATPKIGRGRHESLQSYGVRMAAGQRFPDEFIV